MYPFVTSQRSNFQNRAPSTSDQAAPLRAVCLNLGGEVGIRSGDDTSSSQGSEVTHFFLFHRTQTRASARKISRAAVAFYQHDRHNSAHTLGCVLSACSLEAH